MTQQSTTLALAALIGVGAWVAVRRMQAQAVDYVAVDDASMPDEVQGDTMPDQVPGAVEATWAEASDMVQGAVTDLFTIGQPDTTMQDKNVKAFLDMIAYSEGTGGPNGYRTLFGGTQFQSFADHPRQSFSFTDKTGKTNKTTAAGRYQFLARTWDELAAKLDLKDFGPANQDAAAIELIRQRGALRDVQAGRVATAIRKVAPIWASLPGAGYNQPERKLSSLLTSYAQAGGTNNEATA